MLSYGAYNPRWRIAHAAGQDVRMQCTLSDITYHTALHYLIYKIQLILVHLLYLTLPVLFALHALGYNFLSCSLPTDATLT